jgi:antitoxin YefM
MLSITYSNARQHLAEVMDKVHDEHEPIIITRKATHAVIMISLEDFNSLHETDYLLKSPRNAKRLRESIKQHKEGKCHARDLIA